MGTDLHFRTSLQPAHIRAPPAIGHDREQRDVLTPCTCNNLRSIFVGTLPALSYAAEPRRSSRWIEAVSPQTKDGQKRPMIEGYRCLRTLPRILVLIAVVPLGVVCPDPVQLLFA
jgi:hypothetical protein